MGRLFLAVIGALMISFANIEPTTTPIFIDDPCTEEIPVVETEYIIPDVPIIRTTSYVSLTFKEMDMLESIAMAEAEAEDTKGKALVMRVVLNRSFEWGQSIEEVLYAPNQFATYRMYIKPSENCHEALEMIINGWDESEGAKWFTAGGYSQYGERLWKYGGHYFSK